MKTVTQILQITPSHRKQMIMDTYVAWCMTHVPHPKELQLALNNQRLFNYYLAQYKHLEMQFRLHSTVFNVNWNRSKCFDLYIDITNAIFKRYPQTLLPKITIKEKEKVHANFN